jgi:hypothetical protein
LSDLERVQLRRRNHGGARYSRRVLSAAIERYLGLDIPRVLRRDAPLAGPKQLRLLEQEAIRHAIRVKVGACWSGGSLRR